MRAVSGLCPVYFRSAELCCGPSLPTDQYKYGASRPVNSHSYQRSVQTDSCYVWEFFHIHEFCTYSRLFGALLTLLVMATFHYQLRADLFCSCIRMSMTKSFVYYV